MRNGFRCCNFWVESPIYLEARTRWKHLWRASEISSRLVAWTRRRYELFVRTSLALGWGALPLLREESDVMVADALLAGAWMPRAQADAMPVRYVQGSFHGFLELRSEGGKRGGFGRQHAVCAR